MAHKNLHDWLRDHPEYSLRTKHLNGMWRLAAMSSDHWLDNIYATGDNYEEACYNLLQKLPR